MYIHVSAFNKLLYGGVNHDGEYGAANSRYY